MQQPLNKKELLTFVISIKSLWGTRLPITRKAMDWQNPQINLLSTYQKAAGN